MPQRIKSNNYNNFHCILKWLQTTVKIPNSKKSKWTSKCVFSSFSSSQNKINSVLATNTISACFSQFPKTHLVQLKFIIKTSFRYSECRCKLGTADPSHPHCPLQGLDIILENIFCTPQIQKECAYSFFRREPLPVFGESLNCTRLRHLMKNKCWHRNITPVFH